MEGGLSCYREEESNQKPSLWSHAVGLVLVDTSLTDSWNHSVFLLVILPTSSSPVSTNDASPLLSH